MGRRYPDMLGNMIVSAGGVRFMEAMIEPNKLEDTIHNFPPDQVRVFGPEVTDDMRRCVRIAREREIPILVENDAVQKALDRA